jgi:mutator protein MutT
METNARQTVVAAVVRRGDRLLLGQRPAEKRYGGLWEIPGGKVHPGESDADAVRRELEEELGLTATRVGNVLAEHPDPGSHFLIRFLAVEVSGEPVCREHSALRWATPQEAATLPLAPSDRWFLDQLGAGRTTDLAVAVPTEAPTGPAGQRDRGLDGPPSADDGALSPTSAETAPAAGAPAPAATPAATESAERGIALQHRYPPDYAHCFGCGSRNPHGHHLESHWDGDDVVAHYRPAPHHTSLPGFVYGGLLASLVDCHAMATAAAHAARAAGRSDQEPLPRFVTARLDVRYLRPTPLGPTLELRARPRELAPRKVVVEVEVWVEDTCVVRAEVVAAPMPASMRRGE